MKKLVCAAVMAVACGELSDEACRELGEDGCAKHEDCRLVRIGEIDVADQCLLREAAVCVSKRESKGDEVILCEDEGESSRLRYGECGIEERRKSVQPGELTQDPDEFTMCAPPHPCELRSETNCVSDPRCETVKRVPLRLAEKCLDTPVEISCHQRGHRCAANIVYARHPGVPVPNQFPNGCIPPKWEAATDLSEADSWRRCPAPCEALRVDECKLRAECSVIVGSRVDRARGCIGDEVELGCRASARTCSAPTVAFSTWEKQDYRLHDGCVPSGYAPQQDDAALAWLSCE